MANSLFFKPIFGTQPEEKSKFMTSKIHVSMLMGIVLSVLAVPVQATLISYTSGGENLGACPRMA
jgi:hypothetical protein